MIEQYYLKSIPPSGVSSTTAELLATGQIISAIPGDDGDIEAGRDTLVLQENNPFGNTNRFTDELGGTTYTNNWVIDWTTLDTVNNTVTGYYRVPQPAANWSTSVANCNGATFGTFSGCRIANLREYINLFRFNSTVTYVDYMNYAPFNLTGSFWTGTYLPTYQNILSFAITNLGFGYYVNSELKPCIAVRTFNVSGTVLS